MLKVQLTAAWYHVMHGERVEGLRHLLRHARPDLVLTAMTLPDGTAADVKRVLSETDDLADVPVVAIAPRNDKAARLRALAAGVDDVLVQPYNDSLLLSRIRSFLRANSGTEDLHPQNGSRPLGFAEARPPAGLLPPRGRVALLAQSPQKGIIWREALKSLTQHRIKAHQLQNVQALFTPPAPDVIVLDLGAAGTGLNLLADLKARSSTRHSKLIAVLDKRNAILASEALDLGADIVMLEGFCAEELSVRLDRLIQRKAHGDHLRASVRNGLKAAITDALTGLNNRHFAFPALRKMATTAYDEQRSFAVLLADIDHFKRINDRFGHSAGDHVLQEVARRLRSVLCPENLLARIGGEEFLVALPHTDGGRALHIADRLCRKISRQDFAIPSGAGSISVTMSIGLKVYEPQPDLSPPNDSEIACLIEQADRALYLAKAAGRNRAELLPNAA